MDYFYAIKRTNNKDVRFLDGKINGIVVVSVAIAKKDICINPSEHTHSYYELQCVTSGSCQFMIDGESVSLKPYDIFILAPNTSHRVIDASEDFSKLAISFRMGSSCSNMKFLTGAIHTCDKNQRKNLELLLDYEEKRIICDVAVSYLLAKSLLIQFLFEDNYTTLSQYFSAVVSDNSLAYCIKEYINENCTRIVSVREVAEYCGISQRHLNRILNDQFGCTINDLVSDAKILKIREKLNEGMTAKMIAQEMGYANEFSLVRFVKNKTGKSLSALRAVSCEKKN